MNNEVIVYGLGRIYNRHKDFIESKYHVIARCDKDASVISDIYEGISLKEMEFIMQNNKDCFILCTTIPSTTLPYLVDELHIPLERIKIFIYELNYFEEKEGRLSPIFNFYGENNDDLALLYLLNVCALDISSLRYIEVGVYDPIYMNNSYILYRHGARGILVDPVPEVARVVKMYRPEDEMISAAITGVAKSKTAMFYEAGINSLNPMLYKSFGISKISREYKVALLGINDLMQQAGFVPDILLVDAEGEDERILKAVDYKLYRPKIILAELNNQNSFSLSSFMKEQGYVWFTTLSRTNILFVLEDLWSNAKGASGSNE